MNESQLQSVHLEGLPRREEFRRARARLRANCGEQTLAGVLDDPRFDADKDEEVPTFWHVDGKAKPPSQIRCVLRDDSGDYPLRVGLNSVGRLADNDVVIPDSSISRRHCAIVIHSDMTVELHDTASKNGTLLNGRKILTPTRLNHNDTITICDRTLRFQIAGMDSGSGRLPRDGNEPGDKTQIDRA